MTKPAKNTETPQSFNEQIAAIRPLLPTRYTPIVTHYFPNINAQKLRYAMAGRVEYWDAIPGLRVAAGLDSPPRVDRLNVTPRKQAAQ